MASTYRQVGFGSTGSAVSKLQTILNEHGYGLAVDGIFGEKPAPPSGTIRSGTT